MLKKLFLLIFCLFICSLSCYANNYKLPPQYKIDVENIIDNKYQSSINEINRIFNEADIIYKNFVKNPQNTELYDKLNNTDYYVLIASPEYSLYLDILDVTKKYKFISDDEIPMTDFEGDLFSFLYLYLKTNNVNLKKVYKISRLTSKKQKKIFKYYNRVTSIVSSN